MKDILKETDTAHYIDTITSQKNVNTNKQQQKLYSNLKKEIQYQISQTRNKKRLFIIEKTKDFKLFRNNEDIWKVDQQRHRKTQWRLKKTPAQVKADEIAKTKLQQEIRSQQIADQRKAATAAETFLK